MSYFDGADDPMDALGVSGEDYVGSQFPGGLLARSGGASRALSPNIARLAMAGAAQQQKAAKVQRMRQLVLAGAIPVIALGVRDDSVPANTTETIQPEPSVPMRLTSFTVSPTIAPYFLITQITVARVNLLASGDGIPATSFTPDSRHAALENPVLSAGSQVAISVENIDGGAHPFYGTLWGIDLTPSFARHV